MKLKQMLNKDCPESSSTDISVSQPGFQVNITSTITLQRCNVRLSCEQGTSGFTYSWNDTVNVNSDDILEIYIEVESQKRETELKLEEKRLTVVNPH